MKRTKWLPTIFGLVCCFCLALNPSSAASQTWLDRVDPKVIDMAAAGETEFILYLKTQADLSLAASLPEKTSKGAYVYETLRQTAEQTQAPLRKVLDTLAVEYRPYWIANMIWVRGDLTALQTLASQPGVAFLYANPTVKLAESPQEILLQQTQRPEGTEWNLALVNADDVWAAGFTGQGAVVAGADTGYQWNHPALIRQYRGWDGQTADHNYNWHDAIHSNDPHTNPGNPCGFDSSLPCDDQGHGTHTMGIMVGDDGAANQVGMAPGARWIGCRNMEQGWGTPITYAECYQWFIAPTDLSGQHADPTKAPDVINNSWSCPASEGCTDPQVLHQAVENVRAAGILTVQSAGNSGPTCSSIESPAAIYDASFTVGNTTNTDGLSASSSRGPVVVDGSGRLKPDISAPGTSIRSTYPTNTYAYLSGTSMAAPHVAGMAALLISANPGLSGQVDALERWITQTAVPINIPLETCGGMPSSTIPNNSFGWGRINAWGPFDHRLQLVKTADPASIKPGGIITYTLTVSNPLLADVAYGLVLTDTLPAETSLLSASQPYTLTARTISWERTELTPGAAWTVHLTIQAAGLPGSLVVNSDYGVQNQENWFFTRGANSQTPILRQYIIPYLSKEIAP
jgi:uncharacterized repeat protein (TIGR01451 family)